ncbi:uncharacterized protein LOC114916396 [Cajanus cajan]|uniref:uncharacterized protein LOC114916396 n=1 Tax=Cajanus cajan TaxID=3821 RepID=UPI0010FB6000|nr:uncharacterized protein LOC114916396 [Cajanus cajan]
MLITSVCYTSSLLTLDPMELEKGSTLHLQQPQTPSVWTDEKHLHFLNTMEASFVRTMLHHYGLVSTQPLRLDRYLPDTSESTLDSKPNRTRTRPNHHAPSDSMGPRTRVGSRRRRRRSSGEQAMVAEIENGRESGACLVGGDDKQPTANI